jgi:chromosome partitioning protein
VLAVDLDPQGNVGADLGYDQFDGDEGDNGEELMQAIANRREPQPIVAVRPNLDVVVGGSALDLLMEVLARETPSGRLQAVREPVAAIADRYDLVVMDCPPIGGIVLQAILAAASYVVVPTKRDPPLRESD